MRLRGTRFGYLFALPSFVLGIILLAQSQNSGFVADAQTLIDDENQIFSLESYLLVAGVLLIIAAIIILIINLGRKKNG